MRAKKSSTPAAAVAEGKTRAPTALAVVGSQAREVVGDVARSVGFPGRSFEEMSGTWLRQIVESGATRDEGVKMAGAVVNFLGGMLMGQKSREALESAGLTWTKLAMLMDSSKDFEKVLVECYRIRKKANELRKESMGEDVLQTAYELATDGEEQHNLKTGENLHFKKKSEKMLDRLLVMSGEEFKRDGGVPASSGGGNGVGGGITLNFHFDGKGAPSITRGETVDV